MIKNLAISILYLCILEFQIYNSTYIKGVDFEGYIFNKEHDNLISIEEQKEKYTPSVEDILEVEKLLKMQLKKANKNLVNQGGECPIIHKCLKNYTRQYFGFINQKDEEIIYINFVWNPSFSKNNFSKELFNISDGCSHFWNIKINLKSHKLFDLNINGNG